MKIVKGIVTGLVIVAVVLAFVAPLGPIPGFFIGGQASEAPAQWPDTAEVDEIRLKVPGTVPRVVIIWVVEQDGDLFVVGNNDSGWVTMLGEGGPVEVRIGDATYPVSAERVQAGFDTIWRAYVEKYEADYPEIIASFPAPEEAAAGASIFRLVTA
ncbi:MAG: hypothetical protein NXH85_18065 [Pseudomonadaceae bacterium]|nr:hypothetical protein [Pseudomonadaceae bacterium]